MSTDYKYTIITLCVVNRVWDIQWMNSLTFQTEEYKNSAWLYSTVRDDLGYIYSYVGYQTLCTLSLLRIYGIAITCCISLHSHISSIMP